MLPVIQIGSFFLSTYAVMAILIFTITFLLGIKLLPHTGQNMHFLWYVWIIIVPLGLVGARLLYVLQYPTPFLSNPLSIFNFEQGGYSAYGAVLLPALFGFIVMRQKKPGFGDTWYYADTLIPCLVTGHILWRIFCCFLSGCCHGRPAYGFPLAVTFNHPLSACAYKGIPVHPTQLYEAFGVFLILVAVLSIRNKTTFKGQIVWMYFLLYGIVRFAVEFFRGDVRPMISSGFSLHQGISVVLIITSLIFIYRWKKAYPIRDDARIQVAENGNRC